MDTTVKVEVIFDGQFHEGTMKDVIIKPLNYEKSFFFFFYLAICQLLVLKVRW